MPPKQGGRRVGDIVGLFAVGLCWLLSTVQPERLFWTWSLYVALAEVDSGGRLAETFSWLLQLSLLACQALTGWLAGRIILY